jgi:hypothetical protein
MLQLPPAEAAAPIDEVDTPALLLDLDALERNLEHMAFLAREAAMKLRPHGKTHKSPAIARLQIMRGAVGQCVQKVAEAEILAWGGVDNIVGEWLRGLGLGQYEATFKENDIDTEVLPDLTDSDLETLECSCGTGSGCSRGIVTSSKKRLFLRPRLPVEQRD